MNLNEELNKLKEYFDNVDKETLYSDLLECGLNEFSNPEEFGYVLLKSKIWGYL